MLMRCALLAAFGALVLSPAAAETVSLRADMWCPYNCEPGSDRPGFAVDIAEAAFAPQGLTVDYQLMTWSRALREVRLGNADGAIAATRKEAPWLAYGENGLGPPATVIATRRGGDFMFNGMTSLENRLLVAVNGYRYGEPIDGHIAVFANDESRVRFLSGGDVTERLVRLVVTERVDAVVETEVVLRYAAIRMGVLSKLAMTRMPVIDSPEAEIHIGFTDDARGRRLAALFSEAIARLRENGELEQIMARYGLTDWNGGAVRGDIDGPAVAAR